MQLRSDTEAGGCDVTQIPAGADAPMYGQCFEGVQLKALEPFRPQVVRALVQTREVTRIEGMRDALNRY